MLVLVLHPLYGKREKRFFYLFFSFYDSSRVACWFSVRMVLYLFFSPLNFEYVNVQIDFLYAQNHLC